MIPDGSGGSVSFACRDGETPTYHYSLPDFLEILSGSDPKDFVPDGGGGDGVEDVLIESGEETGAAEIAGDIADIGEIGAIGLL